MKVVAKGYSNLAEQECHRRRDENIFIRASPSQLFVRGMDTSVKAYEAANEAACDNMAMCKGNPMGKRPDALMRVFCTA